MHSTSTNHNADRIIANLLFCVTAMNVQINFGTIQYDHPYIQHCVAGQTVSSEDQLLKVLVTQFPYKN